jgi:hypothetical protein
MRYAEEVVLAFPELESFDGISIEELLSSEYSLHNQHSKNDNQNIYDFLYKLKKALRLKEFLVKRKRANEEKNAVALSNLPPFLYISASNSRDPFHPSSFSKLRSSSASASPSPQQRSSVSRTFSSRSAFAAPTASALSRSYSFMSHQQQQATLPPSSQRKEVINSHQFDYYYQQQARQQEQQQQHQEDQNAVGSAGSNYSSAYSHMVSNEEKGEGGQQQQHQQPAHQKAVSSTGSKASTIPATTTNHVQSSQPPPQEEGEGSANVARRKATSLSPTMMRRASTTSQFIPTTFDPIVQNSPHFMSDTHTSKQVGRINETNFLPHWTWSLSRSAEEGGLATSHLTHDKVTNQNTKNNASLSQSLPVPVTSSVPITPNYLNMTMNSHGVSLPAFDPAVKTQWNSPGAFHRRKQNSSYYTRDDNTVKDDRSIVSSSLLQSTESKKIRMKRYGIINNGDDGGMGGGIETATYHSDGEASTRGRVAANLSRGNFRDMQENEKYSIWHPRYRVPVPVFGYSKPFSYRDKPKLK